MQLKSYHVFFILFVHITSITGSLIYTPLVKYYGNNSPFYVMIGIVFVSLLTPIVVILSNNTNIYKMLANSKITKYFLLFYFLITSLYSITIFMQFIIFKTFSSHHTVLFIAPLVLCGCYIAYKGILSIFHITAFFGLLVFGLFVVMLPLNISQSDIFILLPLEGIEFQTLNQYFFLFFLVSEVLIIQLITPYMTKNISKKQLSFQVLLINVVVLLSFIKLLTITGEHYLQNTDFAILKTYDSLSFGKYINHLDINTLFTYTVFITYRISMSIYLIRTLLKIKNQKKFYIIAFTLFTTIIYITTTNRLLSQQYMYQISLTALYLITVYVVFITLKLIKEGSTKNEYI